jgi:mono/diheme cytochrome c family protein
MKRAAFVTGLLVITLAGCTPDPTSGEGFSLPEGNADRGKQTFTQLQCHACHTVAGVEFAKNENAEPPMIALGGETPRVRTYGDLVTSIINPSHRFAMGYAEDVIKEDGKSKMRIYNDELTVTQLIDLVKFLQSHYQLKVYQPTPYMPYY